jgi:D-amino-acid dehydrogenase
VTFAWNAKVTGWRLDRARGIRAAVVTAGEVEGDEFVLCAGAWSPRLARSIGLRLPVEAGKGYAMTLTQPRSRPRVCAILVEARVAVTPMDAALRFAGTMEIAGLDLRIDVTRVDAIKAAACRYYPDFEIADFRGATPWAGLRPCTPDGLPYIGRTSQATNLVVAAGHAMMGMTLGPVTGRLVAEILAGEPQRFDPALLSPDRYH